MKRGEETFCFITEREERGFLSVGVDEEAREGAVFVGVSAVNFAPVQLYANFISYIQVQDYAVGGIVVVLVCILSDCTGSHLSILLQVRPHARPIAASHQDVVGKVIDTRQRTGELACRWLVVVPYVGHYVIKLQYFVPFVLFPEASVEGDFGSVEGGAIATGSRPRRTRWPRLARLSRGSLRTWGPRKSRAPSVALAAPAVWEIWRLRGNGCQLSLWRGESVTHHLAAPEHLVVRTTTSGPSPLSGVDQ